MNDKSLQFLGLLNRAGKLLIGESLLYKMDRIAILILADDASDRSRKTYLNKAKSAEVAVLGGYSKAELGASLGLGEVSAIGLLDKKAAKKLAESWKGE
ncbi:MAG: hypothetical protein Q4F15_01815 [Bacillota bacterium]|nr:hypothetical protein [Bacillota bacterium]